MSERTIVASATNLLARGFLVVPTDRMSPDKKPVNALFAVARAVARVMTFKTPARAVAVVDTAPDTRAWPPILEEQLGSVAHLLRTLGFTVVEAADEARVVAAYVKAALAGGDDVMIVGVDKRFAQLVSERVWWYDANKDVRYTPEIVKKRFGVPPAQVGEWLALVGDDSGTEVLPGIKGIGAKGATSLLEAHGSVASALEKLDTVENRLKKALDASRAEVVRELARGSLDGVERLPVPLAEGSYRAPDAKTKNALFEELGFKELLASEDAALAIDVCEAKGDFTAVLAKLTASPLAIHVLVEDPAPVRTPIAGIALADGHGHACWVARDTAGGGGAWSELAAWLSDASIPKVGHDLVGAIADLSRIGIVLAGVVGDSACASHITESSNWAPHDLPVVAKHVLGRALPEDDAIRGVGTKRKAWSAISAGRVAEHAGQWADACAAVWQKLSPNLPKPLLADYLEMEDVCVRMELTGIRVDLAELDRAEAAFAGIESELQAEIDALAGHPFNVNSGKQLGAVLFEELGLPVASHTKTGWSTSIEALERIEHAHPIVPLVLRWRALRRLRDNWVVALRKCVDADGRVHSRFHPARSFSGQIVNTNPDLGRVPGRTPEMARIRRAFVAPEGGLLMSVDFNQLGLHVLAHLTKDPALVEPLRRRADMHVLTAAAVLDIPESAVTTEQRQLGKVVNFATFAGQGPSALAQQLGIEPAEAKRYIARFDAHYAKVRAFQDEQLRLAKEEGGIVTIAGRKWPIGGLASLDPMIGSYAERLARRATHEASVQDVSRRALLEADRAIEKKGLKTKPVLQVLDEVIFEVPEAELMEAARTCADAMKNAYALDVPLKVGVEAGKNWADMEPVTLD